MSRTAKTTDAQTWSRPRAAMGLFPSVLGRFCANAPGTQAANVRSWHTGVNQIGRASLRMFGLARALIVSLALLVPGPALAQGETEEPSVRQSIESALEMDSCRQVLRLPRVTLDEASGDLTVIFAMRRPPADDPRQIVASATDDIFTILWAAYTSAAAPRIRTATVLGTYAVVGRYERPREIPLVRAVLSADRATRVDWWNVGRVDPREALDAWWVEGELVAGGPAR